MLKQVMKVKEKPGFSCIAKDNFKEYVNDRGLENILCCTRENVYEDYLEYCREHNSKPMTTNLLMRKINAKYNTTTKVIMLNGKSTRVIVLKEEA